MEKSVLSTLVTALIRAEVSFTASSSWRTVGKISRVFFNFLIKKYVFYAENFQIKTDFLQISSPKLLGDFGFLQRWLHGSDGVKAQGPRPKTRVSVESFEKLNTREIVCRYAFLLHSEFNLLHLFIFAENSNTQTSVNFHS